MAAAQADCYLVAPPDRDQYRAGETVSVLLRNVRIEIKSEVTETKDALALRSSGPATMVDVSPRRRIAGKRKHRICGHVGGCLTALPKTPRAIRWKLRGSRHCRGQTHSRSDTDVHPLPLSFIDVSTEVCEMASR